MWTYLDRLINDTYECAHHQDVGIQCCTYILHIQYNISNVEFSSTPNLKPSAIHSAILKLKLFSNTETVELQHE